MDIQILIFIGIIVLLLTIYAVTLSSLKGTEKELNEYKKSNDVLHIRLGQMQEKLDETIFIAQGTEVENTKLIEQIEQEQENYAKLLSQKKSSETRIGKVSENLVPFLSKCPYNPSNMVFLGQPLDYLVFDMDAGEIIFLEIKSGGSRPSKKQRVLRDIIKSNKVYYEEMRIGTRGVKIKREENDE